jgi:hypothetical protein
MFRRCRPQHQGRVDHIVRKLNQLVMRHYLGLIDKLRALCHSWPRGARASTEIELP